MANLQANVGAGILPARYRSPVGGDHNAQGEGKAYAAQGGRKGEPSKGKQRYLENVGKKSKGIYNCKLWRWKETGYVQSISSKQKGH